MDGTMLWAAVLGLFLGPALIRLLGRRRWWLDALDGYVLVTIGGLGLGELLPHAVAESGLAAVVAALAGLVMPVVLERRMHAAHSVTVALAFFGLAVHAALDGAVLAAPHDAHGGNLDLAVVLHRLPVGLLVYGSVSGYRGHRAALAVVALMAVATVAGNAFGEAALAAASSTAVSLFEAFVVGALLHVVLHVQHEANDYDHAGGPPEPQGGVHHGHDHGHGHDHAHGHAPHTHGPGHAHGTPSARPAVAGAVLGALTLLLLHHPPHTGAHPEALDAGHSFVHLALESAPALLLAYLLASVVRALLVPATVSWLGRGRRAAQALRGVLFGIPLPICSCGVLPLYETLVSRGVPATAAVAFLVATPELGLDALLLSVPLLGAELTAARLVAALAVALGAALLVGRLVPRAPAEIAATTEAPPEPPPFATRLREGLRYGLGELVDHTAPWILVGLGVAAVASTLLDAELLARIPSALQVPLFALVGVPVYVCASGATPLAAVAIANGISPGAALAFLLTGPATNATTFGVMRRLHGTRVTAAFAGCVGALAILSGWGVDALLVDQIVGLAAEGDHDHAPTPLQITSLACLGALFAASLWRQGPRGALGQILDPIDAHGPALGAGGA